ncbi:MAG TPA: phosphotransferase [Burkholderiales bacterium]|nr:phosphotransferase [Burkholderiales bacterium]
MENPAPTDIETALSPEWLTKALATRYPGARVASVAVVETLKTMATKVRFKVDYAAGAPASAPRDFCMKGFFGADSAANLASGASEMEARFYLDVAPTVSVTAPACVYAGIDPANRHGLILMRDLTAAGARFLTALEPYSRDQALGTLDQLARLHARYWDGGGLDARPWLTSKLDFFANYQAVPADRLQSLLEGRRGEPLPAGIKNGQRIYRAIRALHDRGKHAPGCAIHGDAHAGNVFETAQGQGLIDWQLLQRGHWALDVAYHIGAVLPPEERARTERELIEHYLSRLEAHGAKAPRWEQAWLDYRCHLVYGYYLWGITQRVVEPVINEFTRRLGSAVAEHDTFALLGVP